MSLLRAKVPSNLQPLSSEEVRSLGRHIWSAISIMPNHRHNKRSNPEDCETCVAKSHMIDAFKMLKRFGDG